MNRDPELLPDLTPPAGGLARLLAKRESPRSTMDSSAGAWPVARLAFVSALVGVGFALLLLLPASNLPPTHAMDRLLGVRSQGDSLRMADASSAAQSLPTRQPGVRLYWTENLRTPMASEPAP